MLAENKKGLAGIALLVLFKWLDHKCPSRVILHSALFLFQ